MQLLDEQIAQIERPGWEERLHYAEILRLKGWMLSLKGDLEGAERNFLASLDWARPPAGENVGAAHVNQPGTPIAKPRQTPRGVRVACPGLWLVHRGLRHQGFAGGEGAPRRTGIVEALLSVPRLDGRHISLHDRPHTVTSPTTGCDDPMPLSAIERYWLDRSIGFCRDVLRSLFLLTRRGSELGWTGEALR